MAPLTLPPPQNMPVNLIPTCTLFHSLAFVITTCRLIHRRRRKQCSWDDFWALVAVCCTNIVFVLFLLRVRNNEPAGHPPSKRAARIYFTMSLAFTATLWPARISIACSILRILLHGTTRSFVFSMPCFFGLLGLFTLLAKSSICGTDRTWYTDCTLGKPFDIAKLTTDISADVRLVAVPLYLLWHTSLPKAPRYTLRAVFAASISTTSVSTLHAVYGLHPNRLLNGFTAHIEVCPSAVTVVLCNLLVMVMFIYRCFSPGRDLEDEVTEYTTTTTPSCGITFLSFSRISRTRTRTQLTTFFSGARRGSSVFLEPTAAPNSAQDLGHPSCTPELSSVESGGGSAPAKAVHGRR